MKRSIFLLLTTSALVAMGATYTQVATAEPACATDAVAGQELRNRGKLIAARARLAACTQPSCAAEILRDCTRWLDEVNADLPTVVFGAHDDTGADIADAAVFIDNGPAGNTSAGRPVSIDPGQHKIRFERSGFRPVEETIIARGGEKNRSVIAEFVAPKPLPSEPTTKPTTTEPSPASRRVPLATWILGGTGIVGLGVFGYFGASGISDRHRLGCDVGCASSDKSSVDTKLLVADVALGISVVAMAAAIVVYFVSPTSEH